MIVFHDKEGSRKFCPVHLRINPALDEALVDLLAVPGPVRLRAQRAAAVLAENSFATLVIKMIIR